MAQRRMIAKSISTSNKVNRVSDRAALLFTWLIPHCDDYGRMDGNSKSVKAIVAPMRDWSVNQVFKLLGELHKSGLIEMYVADDNETYLEIYKFDDFQTFKSDRDRLSLYPGKTASNKEIPKDSKWKPKDSYKLSEVKLSEVKLSAYPFEDFWKIYPNKVNKKKAQDKWDRMTDENRKRALDDIPKRLEGADWKEQGGKFIPHPTTYLNGERWNDEIRVAKTREAIIVK